MDPDVAELRVLGCLLEKQRTTPDAYPLSLNGLRLACNQATNRDPVVAYDEAIIREALHRLSRRRWARATTGPGSRVGKYRHLLDEALSLSAPELALLGILLLRGAQTPGELKQRTERLHPFAGLDVVQVTLDGLVGRELIVRLPRRPGQKEERYRQALSTQEVPAELGGDRRGGEDGSVGHVDDGKGEEMADSAMASSASGSVGTARRLERLEAQVSDLSNQVQRLARALEQ